MLLLLPTLNMMSPTPRAYDPRDYNEMQTILSATQKCHRLKNGMQPRSSYEVA